MKHLINTQIISLARSDDSHTVQEKLQRAGRVIREGGLVAFPTETVYGLGGDALNEKSSMKIYEAKGRPSDNPLIVHIADMESLGKITTCVPDTAMRLADAFWPGPLTMIMKKSDAVPKQTTGGLDTVAVRFPSHSIAQEFIRAAGGFVAAPSANLSGKPSPTLAKYVIQDMDGRIDMILDADYGEAIGIESTIVDLTGSVPTILRPGFITREMLMSVVGQVDIDAAILDDSSKQPPKAPGMKYRHYAPRGELVIVEGEPDRVATYINEQTAMHAQKGERTGVIGTSQMITKYNADSVKDAGARGDLNAAASRLYTFLREFDDENIDFIYSESFDAAGVGAAVMNRLLKAAGHKTVTV